MNDDAGIPRGLVLVTGATGLLGANLVRRLLADGHAVRTLVLPGDPARALVGLDVERVVGDLRDADAVARAVDGCARVFHVAALPPKITRSPAREREIWDVNVVGTRHVMRAALAAGVARVVLTGSFSAVGFDPDDPARASDETLPYYPFVDWLPYARTKILAEHEALRAFVDGLDVVIAIATGLVGPHDYVPSPQGKMICAFAAGRLRAYIPGGSEFVSTRDIVEGHVLAMERGRAGHRYLFSTAHLGIDELMNTLAELSGRPRARRLPGGLVRALSAITYARPVARLLPERAQRVTPGMLHILAMRRHADCSKAARELGYVPGDIKVALAEAHEFFAREGMIGQA